MDCFCRLSAESFVPGLSCCGNGGSTGLSGDTPRGAGGWDDQADVEDPEEDLTCSRPVGSWIRHGMVRLIRWLLCVRLLRFIRWIRWIRLGGHRPDSRRI